MTPRQAKLGVDIYTGAVIASVALALATFTWRVQGFTGVGPAAAPVAPGGGGGVDIAPVLALSPFGDAVALSASGEASGLALRAIFAAIPMEASVALIAGPDGKVTEYGVGESVGGGVIERIEPEQVFLRTGSGVQTLSIGLANPGSPSTGAAPRTGGGTSASPTPAPAPAVTATPPPAPPTPPPPAARGADAIRNLIPESQRNAAPAPAASAGQSQ